MLHYLFSPFLLQGAIVSLLLGFALGAVRFILEVYYKGVAPEGGFLGFYVGINFLHFAALMFLVCVATLIVVSLLTPAPEPSKVNGLPFQTVKEKIAMSDVESKGVLEVPAAAEAPTQRRLNTALAVLLIATVISLWIYFA